MGTLRTTSQFFYKFKTIQNKICIKTPFTKIFQNVKYLGINLMEDVSDLSAQTIEHC